MSNDQALVQGFRTWFDVDAEVPVGAQSAIDKAGMEFFDEYNVGPKADHYLMGEALVWKVVNALRSAGFEIRAV